MGGVQKKLHIAAGLPAVELPRFPTDVERATGEPPATRRLYGGFIICRRSKIGCQALRCASRLNKIQLDTRH
jgi:hypothetical protein